MALSLPDRIVALAQSYVGIRESHHKNDGAPSVMFMGGRKEPWCAHFVTYIHRIAGAPIPGDVVPTPTRANPLASVQELLRVYREHEWLIADPAPGDLVFFGSRGSSDVGPGMHVGIVEHAGLQACSLISGNWGDSVARHKVTRSDPIVLAYGRREQPERWHDPFDGPV